MKLRLWSRKLSEGRWIALKIAAIYLLVGGLWILFSDWIISWGIGDPTMLLTHLQTLKGWVFVFITAGMLYLLIYRSMLALQKSEALLRKNEATTRTILHAIPDLMVQINPEGRFMQVKPAHDPADFITPAQLTAKTVAELFPLEQVDQIMQGLQKARRTCAAQIYEYQQPINGRPHHYEVRLVAGEEDDVLAIVRDITRLRQTEAELRRANRALKALNESNQALLRATGETELLQQICRIIVEIGQYHLAWVAFAGPDSTEQMRLVAQVGDEAGQLQTVNLTWADIEQDHGPIGIALRTGEAHVVRNLSAELAANPWYIEASRYDLGSGISLPLISDAHPLGVLNIYAAEADAFDAGEVKLLTELATNLAYGIAALRTRVAQQWAEQAFQESEARFRTIITQQSDGIVIVDKEGLIRFVNPATEALLGFPAEALVGELFGFPIVAPGAAAEVNIFRRGHILIVEMRMVEIEWAGNVASLVSFHDVTERKEAEEALRLREMGLNSLLDLSQKASELSEKEIIQLAVEETVKLTQSKIGYLHFVNPDQRTIQLYTWSHYTRTLCTAVYDAHYPLDLAGVWADCARLKQPVIHNDYQNLPDKKGYPEGHVHLVRHLSVPIVEEDNVVVILGVGNKDFDYYESDVRQMLLTADHLWKVIRRKRAEAELQKYQNHLEELVTARTTKLIQANERLSQEVIERQQAEAALRESEERFRLVADFTYDWEFWTGTDGELIYVSPACERVSGYGPTEFQNDAGLMQAIVHPDDRVFATRHFQEELSSSQVIASEWRIIRRDGQERWIAHICQPVYSTDGRYLGRRASNRDITERWRMEAQLQEYTTHLEHLVSEKVHELELERAKTIQAAKMVALGEMATGVAHELNQPLTAMLFEAEYLKTMCRQAKDAEPSFSLDVDEVYHTGESLEQDIARCRRIIDHLRTFGRIYAEHVSRVSLNQSIEQSFILVGERLKNRGIGLDLNLNPQLPLIMADTHKLEQVFLNLISNAEYALNQMEQRVQQGLVEAASYQKILEISTYAEGHEVVALVRDNGCGIPTADQEHLFEPFFTTKPIGQGTGLGLPISYSLVKEFKGEILVQSAENNGTTFTLRFPAANET